MKTTFRSLSCLLLLLAAVALASGATPEMPTAGKFLVLRNGRTLEGDIERIDDQYRVRRDGGETWIPAPLVLRLFLDTDDAYKFLRGKMPANDPDEHLRLAAWCLEVNLLTRATEEALEADHLRPQHRETKQFLVRLQKLAATPPAPPQPPSARPTPQDIGSVSMTCLDLTPESVGHFAQKVQPILLNACGSCHATNRGGSFKLMRTTEVPTLNRQALQENLAAVLAQINPAQPLASPLLTKAVTIHGGDRAPFRNRQAIPYQALEEWVKTTLANNPQLLKGPGHSAMPVPPPLPAVAATKELFADGKSDATHPAEAPPAAPLPRSVAQTAVTTTSPDSGGSGDGDPEEFNRQAHPERYPTTPKP